MGLKALPKTGEDVAGYRNVPGTMKLYGIQHLFRPRQYLEAVVVGKVFADFAISTEAMP